MPRHTPPMLELAEVPDDLPAECQEVIRNLWDYLDGRLSPDTTARLRAHIAACGPCFAYQQFQSRFLELLTSLRARAGVPEHVRESVLARLDEER